MARVAVRLVLAALLALTLTQATTTVSIEQSRPATATWHSEARRTVPAARRERTTAPAPVAAPDYFFPVHSNTFDFGLFVRPPPFLLP